MSRRTSSRRRSTTEAIFPSLQEGVQNGLRRLVSDNSITVAKMLDVDIKNNSSNNNNDDKILLLCENCARVMKQQSLSPSSFMASFFDVTVLSQHALLLQKSGKGSAATLADRIGTAWAKNTPFIVVGNEEQTEEEEESNNKKKDNTVAGTADGDSTTNDDTTKAAAKNTKKKKSASSPKRKKSLQDNDDGDEASASSSKEAKKSMWRTTQREINTNDY